MNNKQATFVLLVWAALGLVGWAAVDTFGWLRGMGIVAAVWLLMPPPR